MAWFWLEVVTKTHCSKLGHAAVSGAGLFVTALFCQSGLALGWLPTDILYSCVASNMCASAKAGLFYHLSLFWGVTSYSAKTALQRSCSLIQEIRF